MSRVITHRFAATLLAAGLLLSACGQSDASGRIRNSSLGEGCFATQAEKDKGIGFYQEFIDLSTKTKNEFENIDKAVKENQVLLTTLYNKATEALNELVANPTSENARKVAEADAEYSAKQKEQNNLFPKHSEAKRNIREYPQFEKALTDVKNKPVCESTPETVVQPSIAEEPTEPTDNTPAADTNQIIENQITEIPNDPIISIPTNQIIDNETTDNPNNTIISIPNNQSSKANIEGCQQPLEVNGGVSQVIRVGETLEFVFPSCSEDSYVTVWGDFETGLSVYSNKIVTENKPFVVVRLSSSQPLSGTYFFQQTDRISRTGSPLSQLDLSVIEADAPVPCAGKVPRVEVSADGVLTAESTCDETDYIEIRVVNIETGDLVVDMITRRTLGNYKLENMFNLFGTEAHEVTAYHVQWDKDAERRYGGRLGDVLSFQFQLKNSDTSSTPKDELIGRIDLPQVFDLEPNTNIGSTSTNEESSSDKANDSTTAKILISATTSGITCSDACSANVIQQSGVAPDNVEKVEASVNGSEWVTLTSGTTLPLLGVSNTVAVRVIPKDGSKSVVLTNTLYRNPEAMSGSDDAEVVARSVGGEQTTTITSEPASGSLVPVILIVVAGVILLLLAMLFIRSRRKSVA
jgi:hypothetical protein